MKRYFDTTEGVPREALAQIEALKAVDCKHIERLVEVQTRGKEIVVAIDRMQDGLSPVSLEMVFNHQKYYRVSERIAKGYLQ